MRHDGRAGAVGRQVVGVGGWFGGRSGGVGEMRGAGRVGRGVVLGGVHLGAMSDGWRSLCLERERLKFWFVIGEIKGQTSGW